MMADGERHKDFNSDISGPAQAVDIDPRIDAGIENIDDEIDGDHQQRRHEDDAEQHVEVALLHGLMGEPAQPRQREHAFHHHRAAQHRAGLQPKDGDHRQQRVAERKARQNRALAQPPWRARSG